MQDQALKANERTHKVEWTRLFWLLVVTEHGRNNHIILKFVVSWTLLLGICYLFCLILEHNSWAKMGQKLIEFSVFTWPAKQLLSLYFFISDSSGLMAAVWFLHLQQSQAWRKSVVFEFTAETQSPGPFLLSTSPLKFFFLIAEKRAGLCFKKKKRKKKRREFFLIWGMSALPCSPALERVPSRAGQCINI